MTSIAPSIATQTIYQQVNPNEYLFPALCRKANGDYLMMARKAPGHQIPPGVIVARTSPTGLAGDWSAEQVVFTPPGARNAAAGIPRKLADGRIAAAVWYDDADTTPPYVCTTLLSTDATATSWVRGGDLPEALGAGTEGGNPCESPIIVDNAGVWWLATYAPETSARAAWSALLFRSADEGATWTFVNFIARASSPSGGGTTYEEPFLLLLANGELIASVRVTELGGGRYTHIYRSAYPGAPWTDQGRVYSTYESGSRAPLLQTPGGTVVIHHRLISGGVSGRGVYHISTDNAVTFGAPKELDSDASTITPGPPPAYSYGDITAIPGGVAMLWADETPISGSGPAIQFKTYAITGEPVRLTIAPTAVWSQSGTTITVTQAPRLVRTVTTASVVALTGGPIQLRGTHASRFQLSLDGVNWAPVVTVPAGTTTIYLGVIPQAADTTLTAQIGIPA